MTPPQDADARPAEREELAQLILAEVARQLDKGDQPINHGQIADALLAHYTLVPKEGV